MFFLEDQQSVHSHLSDKDKMVLFKKSLDLKDFIPIFAPAVLNI
jgi:hypothetical protein